MKEEAPFHHDSIKRLGVALQIAVRFFEKRLRNIELTCFPESVECFPLSDFQKHDFHNAMHTTDLSRRRFLGAVAMGCLVGLPIATARGAEPPPVFRTKFRKASITDRPSDELCERWKAAGMDGMEIRAWNVSVAEAREMRKLVEKHDLRIHCVMRGWTEFHQPDQEKWEASIETMRVGLRTAAACGASALLFAPYELKPLHWPSEPWLMDIDFDPATLKIKTIMPGDNTPYGESIEKQNRATARAVQAIERLIPDAAKEGVVLAIENVRDNFWCTPKFFSAVIRSFDSPWVKAYYDFANHQRIAHWEHWLDALRGQIVKVHVKEFNLREVKGPLGGGPVGGPGRIGGGSIDWRAARKKLDEINYNGWLTIEEDSRSIKEYVDILDKITAGTFVDVPVPNHTVVRQ